MSESGFIAKEWVEFFQSLDRFGLEIVVKQPELGEESIALRRLSLPEPEYSTSLDRTLEAKQPD